MYSYDRRIKASTFLTSISLDREKLEEALQAAKGNLPIVKELPGLAQKIDTVIKSLEGKMSGLVKKQAALISNMQEHLKKVEGLSNKPDPYLVSSIKQLDKLKTEAKGDWLNVVDHGGPLYQAGEIAYNIIISSKMSRWRKPKIGTPEFRALEDFAQMKWAPISKAITEIQEEATKEVEGLQRKIYDISRFGEVMLPLQNLEGELYDLHVAASDINFSINQLSYPHLKLDVPAKDMDEESKGLLSNTKELVKDYEKFVKVLDTAVFG